MKNIATTDTHGHLEGLKEKLLHARLVDDDDNWIAEPGTTFMHLGDEVDRGPLSRETFNYLTQLQEKARERDCLIQRLAGNHEIMLMEGYYKYANFPKPAELALEIRRQILEGSMLAACTDGRRLYTHAGITIPLMLELKDELPANGSGTLQTLADYLNNTLRNQVQHDEIMPEDHPIFWVDRIRGGINPHAGIFWADYERTSSDAYTPRKFPQVIGHTPSRKPQFLHRPDLLVIDIDVGNCPYYGNQRAYLEIAPDGTIEQVAKTQQGWERTTLN